jgi:hypothetical protein
MVTMQSSEISFNAQSSQLCAATKINPDDTRSSIKPQAKYSNKKWSNAQMNMLMDVFLRGATNALLAENIHVTFDNLKLGDLSKLCRATASVLMQDEVYLKESATKRISGLQVQERLRCLVRKVERMQVGCYPWILRFFASDFNFSIETTFLTARHSAMVIYMLLNQPLLGFVT